MIRAVNTNPIFNSWILVLNGPCAVRVSEFSLIINTTVGPMAPLSGITRQVVRGVLLALHALNAPLRCGRLRCAMADIKALTNTLDDRYRGEDYTCVFNPDKSLIGRGERLVSPRNRASSN